MKLGFYTLPTGNRTPGRRVGLWWYSHQCMTCWAVIHDEMHSLLVKPRVNVDINFNLYILTNRNAVVNSQHKLSRSTNIWPYEKVQINMHFKWFLNSQIPSKICKIWLYYPCLWIHIKPVCWRKFCNSLIYLKYHYHWHPSGHLTFKQRRKLVWNNVTNLFQLNFDVVPTLHALWESNYS